MRDFIEDGYIWVWKRTEDDYVLAKDNTGLSAYDVPRDWEENVYDFEQAVSYWSNNPEKRIDLSPKPPTERERLESELDSLLSWFNTYDEKCMQYQRSIRLGVEWDDDISVLDSQAVEKSARIRELRTLISRSN